MENVKQKTEKGPRYSWFLKRQVAIEYLQGDRTLQDLAQAYDIPHQSISRWSSSYAGELEKRKRRKFGDMTEEELKHYEVLKQQNELLKKELESIQSDQRLKEENEALKKELEYARMKTRAMEIVIDLAKEEYGIDLTKNSGAKQPANSRKTTRGQK
jgi:transposase-like protein